jgi:hypothetical protein
MVKFVIYAVLGACIATTPAHAMNSKMYKCGDVDVKLAIVKDNGKILKANAAPVRRGCGRWPLTR